MVHARFPRMLRDTNRPLSMSHRGPLETALGGSPRILQARGFSPSMFPHVSVCDIHFSSVICWYRTSLASRGEKCLICVETLADELFCETVIGPFFQIVALKSDSLVLKVIKSPRGHCKGRYIHTVHVISNVLFKCFYQRAFSRHTRWRFSLH